MKKILVTGATGHFGKKTIESLLQKGISPNQIYALVRDMAKAEDLKNQKVNILSGDYNDYASLIDAFKGIDKLLFISSSDVHHRNTQHQNIVNAAKEAGVDYILYTSVAQNENIRESAIAYVNEVHILTEELLSQSGIPHTIMRNTLYMDLLPFYIGDKVLETGSIYFPAGHSKGAFALRSDMAEAAANILSEEHHNSKIYTISNTESYSYQDVADAISETTGTKISYFSPSPEQYKEVLDGAGIPNEYIFFLQSFAAAHAQGEFDLPSDDLEKLLGRKPTGLKYFIQNMFSGR